MAGVGIPELLLLLWPLLRRLDKRLDKQRVLSDPIKGQQDEKNNTSLKSGKTGGTWQHSTISVLV
jgi:hypothetical protein